MLFQKKGFSQNTVNIKESQKCSSSRCMTRNTMNIGKNLMVNGVNVKLDFRQDCSSESIIYLAICKLCDDPQIKSNFYFGQTINTLMTRCNGHRQGFKMTNVDHSALSMHIMDKHPNNFGEKLYNFDFGVVKEVDPLKLDRCEDYYVFRTEADIRGLNRYKVAR